MPNYTTADDPLAYDQTGYYPGKKQPWYDTAAEIATFGIFDPNNKDATKRNRQITQAQTEQNLLRSKMNEVRNEVNKDIKAFADNLVQYTGIDKVQALKLATEHYQEPSVLAAQLARNKNIENEALGAAPYAGEKGAVQSQDYITSAKANRAHNEGRRQRAETSNALGAPKTQGLGDDVAAKEALARSQGGLATTLDQNTQAELERAVKDPAAEQKFLRDQNKARYAGADTAVKAAQMIGQRTTADAAGVAGDILGGDYEAQRKAAIARSNAMILPQGGLAVLPNGERIENPMYFSTIRNTDADGNTKVSGIRGREYQGTADPVSQPIPAPADPGVIRIPRRSLLNPNAQ